MNILILGINYAPELTGIGKYTGEMAEWLAANGHRVSVVTAPPYYPQWRVAPGYRAWTYRTEIRNGVRVLRCPLWVPRRVTAARRLIHLLSFSISSSLPAILLAARTRPDVMMTIQPPLFSALPGWLAAKSARAKAWLHVQDDELKAAFELGLFRGRWVHGMLKGIERFLLRRFDVVSSISEDMLRQLERKSIVRNRQFLFPNWVDTDGIFPLSGTNRLRAEWGIPESEIVALYAGSMGQKQGLEILAQAAKLLSPQWKVRIVACGEGSTRELLIRQSAGIPNLQFIPLQPAERLNELLNMADIHLLIQRDQGLEAFMPSKLGGMLASGKPVVATTLPLSQTGSIVQECGIVVPPGNAAALADAITQLAGDPARRTRLGDSARRYATAHLKKESILSKFQERLLGDHPRHSAKDGSLANEMCR
ncbi:MAG TPA: WcaI family glycosyltransferase [Elusimicrobiota bacterium]|nr:WcaI family glycosyltransferase [Elusimicrobiota bacterium]